MAPDRKTPKRTKGFFVRLSEKDEQLLHRAAEDAGMDASDVLWFGIRLALAATPRPRKP